MNLIPEKLFRVDRLLTPDEARIAIAELDRQGIAVECQEYTEQTVVLFVPLEQKEKVVDTLDVLLGRKDLLPAPVESPAPYRPSPRCGAPDPSHPGKIKFFLVAAMTFCLSASPKWHVLLLPGIVCGVVFFFALFRVRDWKCRACDETWS